MDREFALKLLAKSQAPMLAMILSFNQFQKQKKISNFVEHNLKLTKGAHSKEALLLAKLLNSHTLLASKLGVNQINNVGAQQTDDSGLNSFFDFSLDYQRLLLLPNQVFNRLALSLGFCVYSQSFIPFILSLPTQESACIISYFSHDLWLLSKNSARFILGSKQNLQKLLPKLSLPKIPYELNLDQKNQFIQQHILSTYNISLLFIVGAALELSLFGKHAEYLEQDLVLQESMLFRLNTSYQELLSSQAVDLEAYRQVLQAVSEVLLKSDSFKEPELTIQQYLSFYKDLILQLSKQFSSLNLEREVFVVLKEIIRKQEVSVCKAFFN